MIKDYEIILAVDADKVIEKSSLEEFNEHAAYIMNKENIGIKSMSYLVDRKWLFDIGYLQKVTHKGKDYEVVTQNAMLKVGGKEWKGGYTIYSPLYDNPDSDFFIREGEDFLTNVLEKSYKQ